MYECMYMYLFTRIVSAQCCATPSLCAQHALMCHFLFLAVRRCRVHDRCLTPLPNGAVMHSPDSCFLLPQ